MLKIGLIVGSTRPNRFADRPARWTLDALEKRSGVEAQLLDLRDYPLPFYNEPAPPLYLGGKYSDPVAAAWVAKIAEKDGFIITAAEYNRSITGVLKNALDYPYAEWNNKAVGFVGYGGVGGARAVEHLRLVSVELQMAPVRAAVHVSLEAFLGIMQQGKTLDDYDYLVQARETMIDQVIWWSKALKAARETPAAA